MKKIISFAASLLILSLSALSAAAVPHTVIKGDSLWKIAVNYQVGLSEIIAANPQFKDPSLIYPGDTVEVPLVDKNVTSYEQQVVDLVNEIRKKNGLSPFKMNWELSRVARYKSQDMQTNKYFSHNSPVYGTPFDMIKSFGISYRAAGENIARGNKTPQSVVDAWMNSSGHRANILNSAFTQIGVGYVSSGHYWTQIFIG